MIQNAVLARGIWYTPDEILQIADATEDLVHARRAKELREGWVLAKICTALGVPRLMLSSSETFDGSYELGSELRHVEVSELLDKGRRRGDEYAESSPRVCGMPINTDDIRLRIADAVSTKANRNRKRFEQGTIVDLMLYQNLNVFRNVSDEVENGIRLAFQMQHPFSRIYVLNGLHNVIFGSRANGDTQTVRISL